MAIHSRLTSAISPKQKSSDEQMPWFVLLQQLFAAPTYITTTAPLTAPRFLILWGMRPWVSWSGFEAGDKVAMFGAGPVGLLAAYSEILRGGVVNSKLFVEPLLELVKIGVANPGFVFSNTIDIDEAPKAYQRFSDHLETKVMIEF